MGKSKTRIKKKFERINRDVCSALSAVAAGKDRPLTDLEAQHISFVLYHLLDRFLISKRQESSSGRKVASLMKSDTQQPKEQK